MPAARDPEAHSRNRCARSDAPVPVAIPVLSVLTPCHGDGSRSLPERERDYAATSQGCGPFSMTPDQSLRWHASHARPDSRGLLGAAPVQSRPRSRTISKQPKSKFAGG